jgi:hypothetical protein
MNPAFTGAYWRNRNDSKGDPHCSSADLDSGKAHRAEGSPERWEELRYYRTLSMGSCRVALGVSWAVCLFDTITALCLCGRCNDQSSPIELLPSLQGVLFFLRPCIHTHNHLCCCVSMCLVHGIEQSLLPMVFTNEMCFVSGVFVVLLMHYAGKEM